MKKMIVIGSGILGASTAYQLAKLGAEVTVVDRGIPGQATDAAAGIICPWISQRRNKAWYSLAKSGAHYYESLIKELEAEGERDTGYARVGALRLHREREKLVALEKLAVERRREAPEMGEIRLLEPDEVKRRFPPLDEVLRSVCERCRPRRRTCAPRIAPEGSGSAWGGVGPRRGFAFA